MHHISTSQLVALARAGDDAALHHLISFEFKPPALFANTFTPELMSLMIDTIPQSIPFFQRNCRRPEYQRDFFLYPHFFNALLDRGIPVCTMQTMQVLFQLAKHQDNRRDMFTIPHLIPRMQFVFQLDMLDAYDDVDSRISMAYQWLQLIAADGNLLKLEAFPDLIFMLLRGDSAVGQMRAMQILEQLLEDPANSYELFTTHFSVLWPILRQQIELNRTVRLVTPPDDDDDEDGDEEPHEEDYTSRELALTLLAIFTLENYREFLNADDTMLDFYSQVMIEDFNAGVDLFHIVITYSRLCSDDSNCHKMFGHPGFVPLLITCTNPDLVYTEARSFILRTLVTLLVRQTQRMISSEHFPALINLFVNTAERGETEDIRNNASTALKMSHCLLANIFVVRQNYIDANRDLHFWKLLPAIWTLLCAQNARRLTTRSSLRKLPLEMIRLVFHTLNGE